jgi:hypothetical protein
MGRLFREPFGGGPLKKEQFIGLEVAGKLRTQETRGEKTHLEPVGPPTPADVTPDLPVLYKEGADYYRTPRVNHPRPVN